MIPEVMREYDDDYQFFYDAAMRNIGGGALNDCFPHEVINRILSGEHPVKVFRQYRRITVDQMARKSGLSSSYIRGVEGGERQLCHRSVAKIANVLKVEIEDLY